ncbi:MAG TPA: hypothetical protein VHD36_22120 [Pirellulales bacterium]|nr:hypothetical protein [Pirellulales bacterium]
MKRFFVTLTLVSLFGSAVTPAAKADYAFGSFGPPGGYYSCWRPWWGGLWGWGPWSGCSGYPAYKCSPTSGYRYRPCLYPPSSNYYGYPRDEGTGYSQYPREFIYDWRPDEGDEQPARPGVRPQYDPERDETVYEPQMRRRMR